MNEIDDLRVLKAFLKYPLSSGNSILQRFSTLAGAEYRQGKGQEQFVYVRGWRKNKVLLVAHVDTIWHEFQQEEGPLFPKFFEDGPLIWSGSEAFGIGADDRAGCAILWLLRDLGHSLLLTDGEEGGRIGSCWLMGDPSNQDLREEVQRNHQFVVQFDRRNGRDYKCYRVGTDLFKNYVEAKTGYTEPDRYYFTDIVTLCRDICGVNLSVGYQNEHSPQEVLDTDDWSHTLNLARNWLSETDLPRFSRS